MKILALIAARGGSKRLPGKNIKQLGGKPLIVWSIDIAKNIFDICDILVSTDDDEIANVSKNAGALVPWLRPERLSNDMASSVDVALHALSWYERENGKIDGLLILQPTSPFRTREAVLRGITIFRKSQGKTVIGVSPALCHPMWCFTVNDQEMQPFVARDGLHLRSQDLPDAYAVNGGFYLIDPDVLRDTNSFYNKAMVPLIMGQGIESLDIDTMWDWKIAQAILSGADEN
jgi:CMP-N,N'-diacetyllegionaminic acid synthase